MCAWRLRLPDPGLRRAASFAVMANPPNPYTPTVRRGDWLYISGQIGMDAEGLTPGGLDGEVPTCMANLASQLDSNGADYSHLVKTTVFLTDMDSYARFNELYMAALGEHRPARSCVEVAALPIGACVEIEAVAYLGGSGGR